MCVLTPQSVHNYISKHNCNKIFFNRNIFNDFQLVLHTASKKSSHPQIFEHDLRSNFCHLREIKGHVIYIKFGDMKTFCRQCTYIWKFGEMKSLCYFLIVVFYGVVLKYHRAESVAVRDLNGMTFARHLKDYQFYKVFGFLWFQEV